MSTTPRKPTEPQIAFFAPQYLALMDGAIPPGRTAHINGFDDVCRYAADCSITGIDLPIGMLDVNRMLNDDHFFGETVEHYRQLGTPIIRLSSHTDGQLLSLHSAYKPRFVGFAPKTDKKKSVRRLEQSATERIIDGLRLGKKLGTNMHQTFPGGRSVPHHDQWSTLPKHFREISLLHLAMQWEPVFEVAAECKQEIGFEIGHVMESIQSVDDLLLFRSFLPKKLHRYVKWGVDTSHFDKEGDSGDTHVEEAIKHNLDIPGHAKDGVFQESDSTPTRHRQNALPFAEQAGKFATFGIMNEASAHAFGRVLWRHHRRSSVTSYGVLEGECMFILNPFQSMRVGAENLRAVINDKPVTSLNQIKLEQWKGKTFESFAESSVKSSDLLELDQKELNKLRARAYQYGLGNVAI